MQPRYICQKRKNGNEKERGEFLGGGSLSSGAGLLREFPFQNVNVSDRKTGIGKMEDEKIVRVG